MGYITRLLVELRLQVWQNDGSMCKIEIISRLQGIGVAKPQPAGQTYFFLSSCETTSLSDWKLLWMQGSSPRKSGKPNSCGNRPNMTSLQQPKIDSIRMDSQISLVKFMAYQRMTCRFRPQVSVEARKTSLLMAHSPGKSRRIHSRNKPPFMLLERTHCLMQFLNPQWGNNMFILKRKKTWSSTPFFYGYTTVNVPRMVGDVFIFLFYQCNFCCFPRLKCWLNPSIPYPHLLRFQLQCSYWIHGI